MSNSHPKQAFISSPMQLEPDWIDYNGHLNMAYYNVLFDRGGDEIFAAMGMGPDYAAERRKTIYTAEIHVRYVREVHLGDEVTVSIQLLDHDEKRLHMYQELRHKDGWLSATMENLTLHVDMDGPRVTPFDPDILAKIDNIAAGQKNLPKPEGVGRSIGIHRKAG